MALGVVITRGPPCSHQQLPWRKSTTLRILTPQKWRQFEDQNTPANYTGSFTRNHWRVQPGILRVPKDCQAFRIPWWFRVSPIFLKVVWGDDMSNPVTKWPVMVPSPTLSLNYGVCIFQGSPGIAITFEGPSSLTRSHKKWDWGLLSFCETKIGWNRGFVHPFPPFFGQGNSNWWPRMMASVRVNCRTNCTEHGVSAQVTVKLSLGFWDP